MEKVREKGWSRKPRRCVWDCPGVVGGSLRSHRGQLLGFGLPLIGQGPHPQATRVKRETTLSIKCRESGRGHGQGRSGGPGSNVEEGEELAKTVQAREENGRWVVRVGWVPRECAAGRSQTSRGWSSCQVGISAQKGLLICLLPPKRQRR